jgi:6-pyruvoyl-tetrahydropterin synthase
MNEETQLAAVFVAFCVALYTSGGDAIHKMLDERAQTLLKDHNEAEDKVIAALQQKLEFLKANKNMVSDFEAINHIREETYVKLNAAGAVRPKHEFKAQVERVLNMIAQEEASVTEKTKMTLMRAATEHVREQFLSNKNLKKAALDDAIAQIKGGSATKGGVDPVRSEFINFFKAKGADAAKVSGDEEANAARAALVAKVNAVCKSEGFYFHFDAAGHLKMSA